MLLLRALSGIEGESEGERVAGVSLRWSLWEDFFWSRSLDVFHYFGAAKASQDAPQVGAMLDLVLGSILDRFLIDFGRFLGCQNAPKTSPDGP